MRRVPLGPTNTGVPPLGQPSPAQGALSPAPPADAALSLPRLAGPASFRALPLADRPSTPQSVPTAAPLANVAPSQLPPGALALPPLATQADVSSDYLTRPDYYLQGAADRVAAYQAQVALPPLDSPNPGTTRHLPGAPEGRGQAVPDAMSQPPPFPRPVTPPPVRQTPSTSLSPPGMGPVEYEERRMAAAARAGRTLGAAPDATAAPSLAIGQGDEGGTQFFNVDDTQVGERVRPPPAPATAALQPAPGARAPAAPQRRATAPRSARAPRNRKTLAPPPTEASVAGSLSPGARSSAGNSTRRRGPPPTGGVGSTGTPASRSPAASATQSRRDPHTPGSSMTLTAAYGVPASAVDEDAVAYSASVRGLGASVGTLTKRLGTLEGHVGDTGRRLQTQGASIEALARSVTALRSTVQQGFAEMKALTKQQHVNANQQVSHPGGGAPSGGSSGASASAGPADLGFRTGRTIRGANPAVPIDTPAFILRDIGAIRRLMNDDLTQRTAWAVINRDVYLDGDEVFILMIDKTMEHRKDEADEAEEWLLKAFDKPNVGSFRSKKGKDRVERVKPFVPLGQVLPHLIEALKKRAVVAYFNTIKVPLDSLDATKALEWYNDDAYTKSLAGRSGIKKAMDVNYTHLGARSRMEKARTVGEEDILHCTSGWYALMSSFVRQHLEALIYTNVRKPRHVDLSCYASWRVELFRVESILHNDKEVHHGLLLVDGDDAARTQPNGDNDDSYEKLYSDHVSMAAEEAAMGALAEADAGAAAAGAAVGAADAEADAAARAAEALARP